MSLNYGILKAFSLLMDCFRYNIFISIIFSSILFGIILVINKENFITNYIIILINIIIIALIGFYYIDDIAKFNFSNPINNMYFYFFNTMIYLLIMTAFQFITKYKKINLIFYCISLINILFSLFMTQYLNNIDSIVIGNIFPMIKFGNIIYIIYYIFIVFVSIKSKRV